MVIHSYIYYHLNDTLVSDEVWQGMADKLAMMQQDGPQAIGCYDDAFVGWDGSTGHHLPADSWVIHKATQLLARRDKTAVIQTLEYWGI